MNQRTFTQIFIDALFIIIQALGNTNVINNRKKPAIFYIMECDRKPIILLAQPARMLFIFLKDCKTKSKLAYARDHM